MSDFKKTICESCGGEFEHEVFFWEGKEIMSPKRCQPCCDREDAEKNAQEQRMRIEEEFFKVCPARYRDTDPARLPDYMRKLAARWEFGPDGIGMIGNPKQFKTRTAFLILKRMIEEGRTVGAITSTKFSELSVDQFDTESENRIVAKNHLRGLRDVDVLLLDDLGKGKITERGEVELYALLEERTSWLRPTIWTCNSPLRELFANATEDRSGAIIRRLNEFSQIVEV